MSQVRIGEAPFGGGAPLGIIAGPCAAESLGLCVEVAGRLGETCAKFGAGYVFKASFDKANRTSAGSGRGPGIDEGLGILASVKEQCQVPVITDIHDAGQAAMAATVCDALQIPAFLCRQTDLIASAAATGLPVQVKKGQFLAPEGMAGVAEKASAAGDGGVLLCERGSFFGYRDLVVDMRSLVVMRKLGHPVVFDATHSVQQPGAADGASGGLREMSVPLARAACAVGVDGLFFEAHPDPQRAVSDAATQLPLPDACALIEAAVRISSLRDELD